jgi:hypothetical protein
LHCPASDLTTDEKSGKYKFRSLERRCSSLTNGSYAGSERVLRINQEIQGRGRRESYAHVVHLPQFMDAVVHRLQQNRTKSDPKRRRCVRIKERARGGRADLRDGDRRWWTGAAYPLAREGAGHHKGDVDGVAAHHHPVESVEEAHGSGGGGCGGRPGGCARGRCGGRWIGAGRRVRGEVGQRAKTAQFEPAQVFAQRRVAQSGLHGKPSHIIFFSDRGRRRVAR